jgi:hypothetical protein
MKVEDEKKMSIKFDQANEFIFQIKNLSNWLSYVNDLDYITKIQDETGSYLKVEINLFKNNQHFKFKIIEFEKNKKIKIKATKPFLFEIILKTEQLVDGGTYVKLKTKCKPNNILFLFSKKKLRRNNRISLENLEKFCFQNQF